ncbi:putative phage abortive infection protein [Aeromonas veronii]
MKKRHKLIVACIALAVTGIWFFYPYLIDSQIVFFDHKPVRDANNFGDLYGALNTLFSGFAFLGVIVSIFMQSEELNDTRREISKQTEQFSSQTDAMFKQSFENTFFQLLGLNNEIIKMAVIDIEFRDQFDKLKKFKGSGRDAFKELHEYFLVYRRKHFEYSLKNAYLQFHNGVDDILGHYFRSIYQTLKLIDNASLSNIQKKEYSNILRAQMSKHELGLLFYNCISNLGCVKFKPLLEKYEFFEHLSSGINIEMEYLLEYDMSVFGFTNRKYFVEYLAQLINFGLTREYNVIGYFELDGVVKKEEIVMMIPPDKNVADIHHTVCMMKNKIEYRVLIWVDVIPR